MPELPSDDSADDTTHVDQARTDLAAAYRAVDAATDPAAPSQVPELDVTVAAEQIVPAQPVGGEATAVDGVGQLPEQLPPQPQ